MTATPMVITVTSRALAVWCPGANIGLGLKFSLKLNGRDGDGVSSLSRGADVDVGKANSSSSCAARARAPGAVPPRRGIARGRLRTKANLCASLFELDELDATRLLTIG